MAYRIPPKWWPVVALLSPAALPLVLLKNRQFKKNRDKAIQVNSERVSKAEHIEMPELDFLELTVLVEWANEDGFLRDPGVSYLFRTNLGALLFDVGFGAQNRTLAHNAAKLGVSLDKIDAVSISHLHPDHMGGLKASRSRQVLLPNEFGAPVGKPCYLPDKADAPGFRAEVVEKPQPLAAGIFSTGPLARSLFFMGWTEEQALVARIKGKGLAVFTGCGHPTIEIILKMVGHLSSEKIYAIGGGLHFPVTMGRGSYGGIQIQGLVGTGKPPWQRITDDDLSSAINTINSAKPNRVLLSAHDTCDHSIERFKNELKSETEVLKAGATYRL